MPPKWKGSPTWLSPITHQLCEKLISLQYFVNDLKEGEIHKTVRMADIQDLKSALKVEAAYEASCRDSHSVQGARVTRDAPCASMEEGD
ncbi:hypothetical protein TNCV_1747911 [Trichonephila clavipes]|nr:hypothetical protein TNCV_1747911 [Trichonephila clavipes]